MFKVALILSGFIGGLSAIWHAVVAAAGEPSWLAYARAPLIIIESSKNGTWLAPVAGGGIAILMLICAAYAFSAAKIIKPLPFYYT